MAEKRRAARVTERIREELSLLLRRDIRDPRVGRVIVSRVEVPDDLQLATVFIRLEPAPGPGGVAPLPDDPVEAAARKTALAGLKAAAGRLRGLLSRSLGLRYTPDLRFVYDTTQEATSRVEALLREIASEKKADG